MVNQMIDPYMDEDQETREAARRADYVKVFSSGAGQRVLADILREGGCFTPHVARFDDRSLVALEGRRWLALDIFDRAGGARDRLGAAMTRDNLKEAMDHDDDPAASGATEPDPAASDPGDAAALFAKPDAGITLPDGD